MVRSATGRRALNRSKARRHLGPAASADLVDELGRWEPADTVMLADDDCLDRVAEGFARVVDAKARGHIGTRPG